MKTARKILASVLALALILCMLPATVVASSDPAHKELAREAIGEGIVLLKNNNDVLPLDSSDSVALFGGGQVFVSSTSAGYQIGGGGSGWVNMDYVPEGPVDVLLEAAKDGRLDIYEPLAEAYKANVSYVPDAAMYDAAAANADTAIMFLTRYSTEGSDISSSNWYLSTAEKTMLQTLTEKFEEVIVLVNAPSMISTDWSLDGNNYGIDVDALLITYMAGEMGAYGMADILLGDVNPSGKLVDTYAMDIDDYPSTETFNESNNFVRYTDDIYVGYRYFETFAPEKVAYEFGYGQSYTTFDFEVEGLIHYADDTFAASVKVTNTGDVAGKEVVQVYCKPPMAGEGTAKIHKSAINLVGYEKTKLLQPGETQLIRINFDKSAFASFDDTGVSGYDSAYVIEAGTYEFRFGNSVKNNEFLANYNITATEVFEQLSELCPTNLDVRMVGSVDATGATVLDEEILNSIGYVAEPVPVPAGEIVVVEGEAAASIGAGMMTETYASGSGFIQKEDKTWVTAGTGTIVGNIHNSPNQNIDLILDVEAAGTYDIGFVIANGSSNGLLGDDILYYSVSADNGATWTKYDTGIDFPNTNSSIAGTGYNWWNLVYRTADENGNKYIVELPEGHVIIRFTVRSDVADGSANANLDKFYLIPQGMTYTVADVLEDINEAIDSNPTITVDLDKDYVGEYVIQLEDVVEGTYTMDQFLAQMSLNELISFCSGYATGVRNGTGSIGTTNVIGEKYGIYSADTADGPAGIRLETYFATYWPCSTLQACTWNTDLIEEIGNCVGAEALKSMVDIWLAPGMNIHRSPLCGRNFEYYSEDPLVTGKSAAALTKGVESTGVAVTLKHFCVNNKEGNRNNSDSRVSEKALREIYLKGFEIACKEADPECIMTSYNYLNGIETSENYDLIHGILRGEWGWDGLIMTDWGNNSSIVDEVNAGNNVKMSTGDLTQLRTAVQNGTLTRETLEENAMYVLNALKDCPDFTINRNIVHNIAATGTNKIAATEFSRRAYQTKFETNGNNFHGGQVDTADADGAYGFFEYTVNAEAAGNYEFFATHTSIYDDANAIQIYVNGELSHTASMVNTGAWTTYGEMPLGTVSLPEGESVIRIQNTVNHGFNLLDLYLTAVDQPNYITVSDVTIDFGESAEIDVVNALEGLTSVTAVIESDIEFTDVISDVEGFDFNKETNEVIVWTDDEAGFAADEVLFTIVYDAPAAGKYSINLDVLDATGVDSDWIVLSAKAGSLLVIPRGDINMDGYVTNADVVTIAKYLVKLVTLDEKQIELADFDADSEVDNSDLVKMAKYVVG